MDVGVVGAGRVGTALAVLLGKAGHRVVAVSGGEGSRERAARFLPDTPFVEPREAASAAEALILGVPDDAIAAVCEDLAASGSLGQGAVVHLSGSAPLSALRAAGTAGATVLSVHPLQTFPTVEAAIDRLPGSHCAVTAHSEEGHALGERLAEDAGCVPFRLDDSRKPLYHAAAVFASNYVTVLVALAARLFRDAGVDEATARFGPLSRAALENALHLGPEAALTGPAVRGDVGTLRRNLEALRSDAPDLIGPYVHLARAALDLAERSGRLDPATRREAEEALSGWS
jgi:predicted short-subunit dehydrogenase-like oxidoreductase (DUF2520 family)